MRWWFVAVVAVVAGTVSPAPAAAAEDAAAPACLRLRLGSSDTLLTVGWYFGVWRALEEGSFEFGVRLSFSRAPRPGLAAPRPRAAAVAPLEEIARRPASRTAALDALVETVVAYGVLPGTGGVARFLSAGDRP